MCQSKTITILAGTTLTKKKWLSVLRTVYIFLLLITLIDPCFCKIKTVMQPEFLAVITTYFSFQEQNQNIGCKLPSTVTSASALILIFTSITPHIYCTPGDLVFHRGQLCCWRFGQWGVEEGGSALPIRLSTPPFWKSEGLKLNE